MLEIIVIFLKMATVRQDTHHIEEEFNGEFVNVRIIIKIIIG
jgi:hypothetical protein